MLIKSIIIISHAYLCLRTGSTSRATGVIIGASGSSRVVSAVPAPFVPEDLVTQAQVVLQGKSRSLIIRELQVLLTGVLSFMLRVFQL